LAGAWSPSWDLQMSRLERVLQCLRISCTSLVASTAWVTTDHQGWPSTPTNSLYQLHMARYQALLTCTAYKEIQHINICVTFQRLYEKNIREQKLLQPKCIIQYRIDVNIAKLRHVHCPITQTKCFLCTIRRAHHPMNNTLYYASYTS